MVKRFVNNYPGWQIIICVKDDKYDGNLPGFQVIERDSGALRFQGLILPIRGLLAGK